MSSITNEKDNNLSDIIKKILPSTDRIDTLVGYFYFSGFQEIYKELLDKHVRILVGMEIDQQVLNKISSIDINELDNYLRPAASGSRLASRENYYNEFVTIFNKTDYFDSNESLNAFEVFVKKIKNGTLEIKKTSNNQHGKFYIFHYKNEFSQEGMQPGMVISGSSNLTYNGLKGQGEHNLILRENHYYHSHLDSFKKLWDDSENIIIVDKDSSDEFFSEIKKRIWLYAEPKPYHLYLKVLDEYFKVEKSTEYKTPSQITDGRFSDLQYQIDAINLGIDRIDKFNGVIIADVVGLGKSIIASAIAHNMELTTIVIAPPHLLEQWNDYRLEFNFNADIYSTGKIQEAAEKYAKSNKKLLIILDEAHKHRNEDNESYKALHKLCVSNKIVALSATPFNNDPKDIYALIKLFSTPGQSTLKTVENLSMEFHKLFQEYNAIRRDLRKNKKELEDGIKSRSQELANKLRAMIEPLVIRRSRLDLQAIEFYKNDLKKQGFSFSEVKDPRLMEYELGDLASLYLATLEKISPKENPGDIKLGHFIGARYKPVSYIKEESDFFIKNSNKENAADFQQSIEQAQVNVAKFMRRLLVRRFESSIYSFEKSLNNMLVSAEKMLDWYNERNEIPVLKKGYIPEISEFDDLNEDEVDEVLKNLEEKGLIRIPVSEFKPDFIIELKNDIDLLKEIRDEWFGANRILIDPKLLAFCDNIKYLQEENNSRKIVVFTEFSDTADYLAKKLIELGNNRVFKYSSKEASTENKKIIKVNFDAGLPDKDQKNDFDILIATDAISEGYNLHRAGVVFNYDIPYNPTKVIQRVGRINRINKKMFDELYIYNCFPTITGEAETRTKAISSLKMGLIHSLMGEDIRYLSEDEELHNYFAKQYADESSKIETESWDAIHRNNWLNFIKDKKLVEIVNAIPHRTRISRLSKEENDKCIIAFGKRGSSYVFANGKNELEIDFVSPEKALNLFISEPTEDSQGTTSNFDELYQKVKQHIFKNNTHPRMENGSRRFEVCAKLDNFSEIHPNAKNWCYDVIKIIKDYDSLPDGLLKDLAKINPKTNSPEEIYREYKKLLPDDYIKSIFEMAEMANSEDELIVLTEELV